MVSGAMSLSQRIPAVGAAALTTRRPRPASRKGEPKAPICNRGLNCPPENLKSSLLHGRRPSGCAEKLASFIFSYNDTFGKISEPNFETSCHLSRGGRQRKTCCDDSIFDCINNPLEIRLHLMSGSTLNS